MANKHISNNFIKTENKVIHKDIKWHPKDLSLSYGGDRH